jgi:hypothetical protein
MDVNAIRNDIADALAAVGYTAYAYAPEAIKAVPACVVNVPTTVQYDATFNLSKLDIVVTVVVQANDYKSGQASLDQAMSVGVAGSPGSVVDTLRSLATDNVKKVEVTSAGNGRLVEKDNLAWLALDIDTRVTAPK